MKFAENIDQNNMPMVTSFPWPALDAEESCWLSLRIVPRARRRRLLTQPTIVALGGLNLGRSS